MRSVDGPSPTSGDGLHFPGPTDRELAEQVASLVLREVLHAQRRRPLRWRCRRCGARMVRSSDVYTDGKPFVWLCPTLECPVTYRGPKHDERIHESASAEAWEHQEAS